MREPFPKEFREDVVRVAGPPVAPKSFECVIFVAILGAPRHGT